MKMIVPDRAEYEESDSSLAKYTIATKHEQLKQLEKENEELKAKVKYWVDMYEELKKRVESKRN